MMQKCLDKRKRFFGWQTSLMAFMAIFVEELVAIAYWSFIFFASVTPHEYVLTGQAEQLLDRRGNQTRNLWFDKPQS